MLEKKYYELMGYENVKVVEDGGSRWLEDRAKGCYSSHLSTICWSTEEATNVMLRHKINVKFYEAGVEAWHNDFVCDADKKFVEYHRDKSMRAYFNESETFNVAVLQAAVEMLERREK